MPICKRSILAAILLWNYDVLMKASKFGPESFCVQVSASYTPYQFTVVKVEVLN